MKRIYEYSGKGKALSSEIKVLASTRKIADRIAEQWMAENLPELSPEERNLCCINISGFFYPENNQVLHAWDGDY